MLYLDDVEDHIAKCKAQGIRFDWLGFVENDDISSSVRALFESPSHPGYYDWVNGNEKLWKLEKEVE
jgi:hypothetical protein